MTVNLVYLKLSQYHVYGMMLVSKLTFKLAGCQCRCKSLFCVPNSHLSCLLSALKAEITCNENTNKTKPSTSLHSVSISSKTCQDFKVKSDIHISFGGKVDDVHLQDMGSDLLQVKILQTVLVSAL